MGWFDGQAGVPIGIKTGGKPQPFINRSGGAVAVGDVLKLDMTASDADVSTFNFGGASSVWANAIDADDDANGYFVLVQSAAEDNKEFFGIVRGVGTGTHEDSTALTGSVGDAILYAAASGNTLSETAGNGRILARPMTDVGGYGNADQYLVLFNGIPNV